PRNLLRVVKLASGKSVLGEIGVHTLRHTYATVALLNRVPLHVVRRNLGHSSIAITADIRADLDSGVDRWPVVGRSHEFRQLTAAVLAGGGAVISGPAGAGKTTVALTGVELAHQRGMSIVRSTATRASRGLPFGAF